MANNRDNFYNPNYKPSLKKVISFELKSRIGKLLKSKKNFITNKKFLNIGCGSIRPANFMNIDFYEISFKNPLSFLPKKRDNFVGLDLRNEKLPFAEATFEGVFTEHALEHFYPDDVKNIISEIFRVLKLNGVIRIIIPDLEKYIKYYNGEIKHRNFEIYRNKNEAIWSLTQNYGHHSVWDFFSMKNLLTKIGFEEVKLLEFGKTQNVNLKIDRNDRSWNSLYIEAKKLNFKS